MGAKIDTSDGIDKQELIEAKETKDADLAWKKTSNQLMNRFKQHYMKDNAAANNDGR